LYDYHYGSSKEEDGKEGRPEEEDGKEGSREKEGCEEEIIFVPLRKNPPMRRVFPYVIYMYRVQTFCDTME